jgi:hypothetical protein
VGVVPSRSQKYWVNGRAFRLFRLEAETTESEHIRLSKKMAVAAAILLGATSATLAQTNGWYGSRNADHTLRQADHTLRQNGYYGTPYGTGLDYGYGGGDQYDYGPGYSYGKEAPADGGGESVR